MSKEPKEPGIWVTLLQIREGGGLSQCDTIEYDGKIWLVPEWLEAPSEGWKKPERIVLLSDQQHQHTPNTLHGDYVLNSAIPKAVFFDNPPPKDSGYLVIIEPDIKFPIPRGIH